MGKTYRIFKELCRSLEKHVLNNENVAINTYDICIHYKISYVTAYTIIRMLERYFISKGYDVTRSKATLYVLVGGGNGKDNENI